MCYSFGIVADNKEEARSLVEIRLDEIIKSQPVHEKDRAAILKNADTVIDLLADDATKDVAVSVNGYISTIGDDIQTVSISVTANNSIRTAE